MDDEGDPSQWPGGGLICQVLLAAAREFLATGLKTDANPASGTQEEPGWLAALLQSSGGTTASGTSLIAADFMAQAWMIAILSSFRYWRRLARLYEDRAALLTGLVTAGIQSLSEQEQRLLIDQLRGLMREAGDAASQEARRFEAELDRLSLGLAAAVAPGEAGGAPHRYARAKA